MIERPLHQHGVEPAAEFPSNRFERSNHSKAQGCVQRDRGMLGRIADDGDHLSEAARLGFGDHSIEQQTAQALPLRVRSNVDGIFDCEAVRRPRSIRTVRISGGSEIRISRKLEGSNSSRSRTAGTR